MHALADLPKSAHSVCTCVADWSCIKLYTRCSKQYTENGKTKKNNNDICTGAFAQMFLCMPQKTFYNVLQMTEKSYIKDCAIIHSPLFLEVLYIAGVACAMVLADTG